jgi:DNA/RNA endonuclease G (NUC1)
LSAFAVFAQFFEGKEPSSKKPVQSFSYTYYVVGYSNESRTLLWSAMEVKNAGDPILGCKRVTRFTTEQDADPQITHKDYNNQQGYSRGHMTPNAVVAYTFGCDAAKATFVTSNIVPQLQKHNAGVWESLEAAVGGRNASNGFVTGLVQKAPEVWVYTGPVFWGKKSDIQRLGEKEIWIPTAIWKTVIWKTADGTAKTCSWMIPHRDDIPKNAYMEYVVSIKDIYRKTGVNILGSTTHPLFAEVGDQAFLDAVE